MLIYIPVFDIEIALGFTQLFVSSYKAVFDESYWIIKLNSELVQNTRFVIDLKIVSGMFH